MNISIGYLPNRYREFTQDEGGHFPFAVDNTFPDVLSVGVYLPKCDDNFVPSWMDNIKAFPLYFYADIDSFLKNEYEEILNTSQIEYRYLTEDKKSSVSVAKIQDIEQLLTTFPFYIHLDAQGVLLFGVQKRMSLVLNKGNGEENRKVMFKKQSSSSQK